MKGLFTNIAGADILKDCVHALVQFCDHDISKLQDITILLPTRRAIRIFEELLPDMFDRDSIILPKLMAIGDIEMASDDDDTIIPPLKPISGIERIVSIIPFIETYDNTPKSYDARWRQAKEILKLIDLLQTENLTPDALKQLDIKMDMAAHWSKSGDVFIQVANDWLAYLHAQNRINKAAARVMHIERLTQTYRDRKPEKPIWFIGSTGSILAVRDLMRAILALPQGLVLLPGLDKIMNDDAWAGISDSHPQAILKNTISFLGYEDRRHIAYFPTTLKKDMTIRAQYLSNALSPCPIKTNDSYDDIALVNASNRQEELYAIAQICLEHKTKDSKKHIVIVSNDAQLPPKLTAMLSPYGFHVDSSSGLKLKDTSLGVMINDLLTLLMPSHQNSILTFWTLLKNPDFLPDWTIDRHAILEKIEYEYLRDPLTVPQEFSDILSIFPTEINNYFDQPAKECKLLYNLPDWAKFIKSELFKCINLKSSFNKNIMRIVTDALDQISAINDHLVKISYDDAAPIIADHLNNLAVRDPLRKKNNDKAIQILGTLEARLIQSDVTIMANLNENIWPDAPAPNPYLSRGMRHAIGLPDTERHAALSGHDFHQAFLSGDIIMTTSKRDGDTPALPSRWLLRLQTVLDKPKWDQIIARGDIYIDRYKARHHASTLTPALPPSPIADIAQAPNSLYVTHVELWRHDPYSFWAKHILGLRSLNPFLGSINAATRGSVWHDILKEFVEKFDSASTPHNQEQTFDKAVAKILNAHNVPPHMIRLWTSRLSGQRAQIIALENERRVDTEPWKLEEKFEGIIDGHTIKAKADRVDIARGRSDVIVADYKTGTMPTKANIKAGFACQLSLLALIVPKNVLRLDYIDIKGGNNVPKPVCEDWDDVMAEETRLGFANWYTLFFNDHAPFVSYADFGKHHQSKAQDYLQLARFDEWGAGIESDEVD